MRLSLADIASFDRATPNLLMQREEHHSPDANNLKYELSSLFFNKVF